MYFSTAFEAPSIADSMAEDSKDQFYDQLVVDDRTHVEVVGAEYVETPIGLLFQLTSTQVADLNEQLKYYAEELADEEAGVCDASA